MAQTKIDLYSRSDSKIRFAQTTVLKFHEDVRDGKWQDLILPLRAAKQRGEDIKTMKEALPMATGSGSFKVRNLQSLEKHSGFIVVDIDKLSDTRLKEVREALMQDSLFYSVFSSCSGSGLCGFVKVNPKAHEESFFFLSEHMYYKYEVNIDIKCKDITRTRFVTYDPDLYLNTDSQLCPIQPAKKKPKKPKRYHFASEDFERIIADIKAAEYDLTDDYQDWIYCGFALAKHFGEEGRQYFHAISEHSDKYDYYRADEKYTHLLQTQTGEITIDWFYHIIEVNGFQAYSRATEEFLQQELGNLRAQEAGLIDKRPLSAATLTISAADIPQTDTGMQIKNFLHAAYKIRKNEMTQAIEVGDEMLDDELLNTIYLICRASIEDIRGRELVYQVLDSRFTPRYHEFKDMMIDYANLSDINAAGSIDRLIATIETDTPHAGYFIKKWLVSIVGSMYGKHSPLMLILSGKQNTGKTVWFRNLLPERLRVKYYAESKMEDGKDDRILMSKKMLILDDEMSGKNKQEESALKSTLSRQQLDLRVPFGRTAATLNRIAVLCGTSNEDELVSDPTGNRRLIPINVISVNFEGYNTLNKDLLFYEAYCEYMAGYNYELTNEDIVMLKDTTKNFKKSVPEEDLILRYFGYPDEHPKQKMQLMSVYDIVDYIKARTRIAINNITLGKYLKALEFEQKHKKFKKTTTRVYKVIVLDENITDFEDNIDDIA